MSEQVFFKISIFIQAQSKNYNQSQKFQQRVKNLGNRYSNKGLLEIYLEIAKNNPEFLIEAKYKIAFHYKTHGKYQDILNIAKEIPDDYKNIKMLMAYCYKKIDDEESAFKLYKEIANKNISSQSDKMDNIRYTNQPNLANPDFLTENKKNIINYLYNTIYLNYSDLTGIPNMNNLDFIQFMKTKVKNPEDIEKNLLKFVFTKKIPLTKQNKCLSRSIKNILMKKPM
ncbi:1512_t:CDS:2, partial [Dentiscutata erythropus]